MAQVHDSVLQSLQGVLLLLNSARTLLPDRPEAAANALEAILDRGESAVSEGHSALQEALARSRLGSSLEVAFAALCGELMQESLAQSAPTYRVIVKGRTRALAPLV